MAYAILTLAVIQLIIASYNFGKRAKTILGFFFLYINFGTMFITFIIAFIMMFN